VLKLGKTLGFTQVDLFTEDGKLAATGRHTKAM
jgi:acyl-coenzyme A thioesterase PaaI-like protein